jgi:hypothetical protein
MADNFTISKSSGYANITIFQFYVNSLSGYNYKKYIWDFGDSVRSRVLNPTHIYKSTGKFTITLIAYKADKTFNTYKQEINVSLLLNESIYFDFVPPPTFAGHINRYPFKVNITSANTDKHVIDLYANYSRSYDPQDPNNKWTFLRPQWRFLDLSGRQINQIETKDTIIKANSDGKINNSGLVAGVTGTAEFYFVDDIYNSDLAFNGQPYTTVIATLQTSSTNSFKDTEKLTPEIESFSNSTAQAITPYIFLWRTPDYLKITEDGGRIHTNPRWVDSNIPTLISPSYKTLIYPEDLTDGNPLKPFNPDFSFVKYLPLGTTKTTPLSVGIFNKNITITPTPLTFKYLDEDNYKVSGYYKGIFSLSSICNNVSLTAKAIFDVPDIKYYSPLIWIPNKTTGTLNISQYIKNNYTDKLYYSSNKKNDTVHNTTVIEMPIKSSVDFTTESVGITGFNGIECIAALPQPDYHAWAIDSEIGKLYRVSTNGKILLNIDINKILNLDYSIPYFCAADSEKNVWVTIMNTSSTLKISNKGKLLFGFSPSSEKGLNLNLNTPTYSWIYDNQYYPLTSTKIENFIIPTCVDTDTQNNAWITYSSPFSGFLNKVSSSGSLLQTITLPVCSCPNEIICDNSDNVWVSLSNNIYRNNSYLEKRNSNGVLLKKYGPFNGLNNLTIDDKQQIWFTHSYQYIGNVKIDGSVASYKIPLGEDYQNIPNWIDRNNNTIGNVDESALAGIAYDGKNNIIVINSLESKIMIFDTNEKIVKDYFYINPKGFSFYPSDTDSLITRDDFLGNIINQNAPTKIEYHPYIKSIKTLGDFTGFRWINKYLNLNTSSITLTGSTRKLDFYTKNPYEIFKVNENHDFTEQIKSVSFVPSLQNSTVLFDELLHNIYGNSEHDDLGIVAYEKVANFLANHSDIDTCSVKSLYDLADSVDQDTDDFKLNYPIGIKRLMDIASINKSKVWGTKLYNNYYIDKYNIGKNLNTISYNVTAGVPVLLKTKSLGKYRYIETGKINDASVYDLNILSNFLHLESPWSTYYEYFEFVNTTKDTQLEGTVDWNNVNTTLQFNNSSLNNWIKDEGILETSFSYELYKGLKFLE